MSSSDATGFFLTSSGFFAISHKKKVRMLFSLTPSSHARTRAGTHTLRSPAKRQHDHIRKESLHNPRFNHRQQPGLRYNQLKKCGNPAKTIQHVTSALRQRHRALLALILDRNRRYVVEENPPLHRRPFPVFPRCYGERFRAEGDRAGLLWRLWAL